MEKQKVIIFYENNYDGNKLVWVADKKYNIINETEDIYYCDSETPEHMGIEKSIKNMYYIERKE